MNWFHRPPLSPRWLWLIVGAYLVAGHFEVVG